MNPNTSSSVWACGEPPAMNHTAESAAAKKRASMDMRRSREAAQRVRPARRRLFRVAGSAKPASELFGGNRQHRRAAADDSLRIGVGLRQQALGVEARGCDLGPKE